MKRSSAATAAFVSESAEQRKLPFARLQRQKIYQKPLLRDSKTQFSTFVENNSLLKRVIVVLRLYGLMEPFHIELRVVLITSKSLFPSEFNRWSAQINRVQGSCSRSIPNQVFAMLS